MDSDSDRDLRPFVRERPKQQINESGTEFKAGSKPNSIKVPNRQTCLQKYKWVLLGIGIFLIAMGVVALVLMMHSDSPEPHPDPTPDPPTPPEPDVYNPYIVSSEIIQSNDRMYSGFLTASSQKLEQLRAQGLGVQQPDQIKANPRLVPAGPNNQVIANVSYEFGQSDFKTAYLRLDDANQMRYVVPEQAVNRPMNQWSLNLEMVGFKMYKDPFGFEFRSFRDPDHAIVSARNTTFIMMDKYIQLDLKLPSRRIYGLGERMREFTLQEGTWTMWATNQKSQYDAGQGGYQSHGVHPFVLVQTAMPGEFFGLFFRNSNAMSPVIQYKDVDQALLSFITTGGQLEIYFLFKGSAKQIIQAYQNLVGKPSLPPLWALGWNTASSGYEKAQDIITIMQEYELFNIPLEGVWLDLPYMHDSRDFTLNETAFPDMIQLQQTLASNNIRLSVILEASLPSIDASYKYFAQAVQDDLLIKSSVNPEVQEGAVTQNGFGNTSTVFLDFFNDGAKWLWAQGLNELHQKVPFDGLQLDMNEPRGNCDGECPNGKPNPEHRALADEPDPNFTNNTWWYSFNKQDEISTFKLPFIPGGVNLDHNTLSLNATHPSINETEYNLHNLYGHMQGKITREILTDQNLSPIKDKRPFILSRSTYSGSGQYVAHYSGSNEHSWDDMRYSIASVMNLNMFGLQMSGTDTCGFYGDDFDEQLCSRWIQLSSMMPFAWQNIDNKGWQMYQPYRFDEPHRSWVRNSLFNRLQYVRLMYTCLFDASQSGTTCVDPLQFHYPNIADLFDPDYGDTSFIIANAIKISPILQPGVSAFKSYFPNDNNGTWVSLTDLADFIRLNPNQDGEWRLLKAPNNQRDVINMHLRPGYLIPFQNNTKRNSKTTKEMQAKGITLFANRDNMNHAWGKVFIDDGETLSSLNNYKYQYYEFSLSGNILKKWVVSEQELNDLPGLQYLDQFVILNAEDLADVDFACFSNRDQNTFRNLQVRYDYWQRSLNISALDGEKVTFWELRDLYFGRSKSDVNPCLESTPNYRFDGQVVPNLTDKHQVQFNLISNKPSLKDLVMTLSLLERFIVNIHWTLKPQAGIQPQFEVPFDIVPLNRSNLLEHGDLSSIVTIISDQNFNMKGIKVANLDNAQALSLDDLFLEPLYNYQQIKVYDKDGVIGLSDRVGGSLFLEEGVYSFWNMDTPSPQADGKLPGKNLYGTHPFMMAKCEDDAWMGIYNNLAAAQDWWITKHDGYTQAIVQAVGGVGDISVMFGKSPEAVVKQYQSIIGKPVKIPQWSLGWHQSRWRYENVDILTQILQNYTDWDLPLDGLWNDIDYMDRYRSFSIGKQFGDLGKFVQTLHDQNKHYVPILDAGIAYRQDYQVYKQANDSEILLMAADGSDKPFIGMVWPNDAVWVDFFNPLATDVWGYWLEQLHQMVGFDGLWLDMNEASDFCPGACYYDQQIGLPNKNNLRYVPTGRDLQQKSIDLDVMHYNNYTELDTHSLMGTKMSQATNNWFTMKNKRTMIIERSAFAGAGKFASRWLGDNWSSVELLGYSITGIMAQNIMGIPLAGSDICGFMGDTTPELCARWYMAGAFYPFSRNHNSWNTLPQEPWVFAHQVYEGTISYLDIIKHAMQLKLKLVRYSYSCMLDLSLNGGTYFKPLLFEFQNDLNTYKFQQNDFMLGQALKVSVLTTELGTNSTGFYFPAGNWCNVFGRAGESNCVASNGQILNLRTKAYDSYVHLRQGYIVPLQDLEYWRAKLPNNTFQSVTDMQKVPTDMHVNPVCNETSNVCIANGQLFNDDGLSLQWDNQTNLYKFEMNFNKGLQQKVIVINIDQQKNATDYPGSVVNQNDQLGSIQIYRAKALGLTTPFSVKPTMRDGSKVDPQPATYDATTDRLIMRSGTQPWNLPAIKKLTLTPGS